ncbi:MAG: hypothetical protein KKA70_10700 [Proteobacteria bacterium]|nr:hypothetical protein [Pseudomonadota bacterium]
MNPADILYQAFSNLTGGLINDLQSAMVALISLALLVHGFNILNNLLDRVEAEKREEVLDWLIEKRGLTDKYNAAKDNAIIKEKLSFSKSRGDF